MSYEAICREWKLTTTGRLVTAVGRRVADDVLVCIDTRGAWCFEDGAYTRATLVDGKRTVMRPPKPTCLLNKHVDVPVSLYTHLMKTTPSVGHVRLSNGKTIVPLAGVNGTDVLYLNHRGAVNTRDGYSCKRKRADEDEAPCGGFKITNSVFNSRSHTLGHMWIGEGADACIGVTIRKLQDAHTRTRARK